MTIFPQYFVWDHQQFIPIEATTTQELLVADSWRVHRGESWGLTDHVQRFITGMSAQSARIGPLPQLDPIAFTTALQHKLFQLRDKHPTTQFFPRISIESLTDTWRITLLVRPAPIVRTTTRLWIPKYTDPRTTPTIKGPDISLLGRLVSEVPADDVVLHDGTHVSETTTGALMLWDGPKHLVLCQATAQLASISAQRIANYATSQGVRVTRRPVTLQEIASGEHPVWFSNTVHGISPVSTVGDSTGTKPVATHPSVAQWQAAWWTQFTGQRRNI